MRAAPRRQELQRQLRPLDPRTPSPLARMRSSKTRQVSYNTAKRSRRSEQGEWMSRTAEHLSHPSSAHSIDRLVSLL
jgi:hypothetical protein